MTTRDAWADALLQIAWLSPNHKTVFSIAFLLIHL